MRQQIDARPAGGLVAADLELLRRRLRLQLAQLLIGCERGFDGLVHGGWQRWRGALFLRRLHAVLGGVAERHRERGFGRIAQIFQIERGLTGLRDSEFGLLLRQRQRAAFLHLRLDGGEHALPALDIFARQLAQPHGPLRVQV